MKNLEKIFTSVESKFLELEPKQRELVESSIPKNIDNKQKLWYSEKLEREIYYWKLSLKYKLYAALSKYITQSDTISDIKLFRGHKGLEIICQVFRDSVPYYFSTECIDAGGYNIQCFHFRYITKTTLGKVENEKSITKYFSLIEKREQIEYLLKSHIQKRPTIESIEDYRPKMELSWYLKNWENYSQSLQKQITEINSKISKIYANELEY